MLTPNVSVPLICNVLPSCHVSPGNIEKEKLVFSEVNLLHKFRHNILTWQQARVHINHHKHSALKVQTPSTTKNGFQQNFKLSYQFQVELSVSLYCFILS